MDRTTVLKWIGTACILLLGVTGLYLLVAEDPYGGEPVHVARIVSGPAKPDRQDAGIRPSITRDGQPEPLPSGHRVAPADIVIRDPMSMAQAEPGRDLDPALTEPGPHGPLPRIGPDGETSARAYAAPVSADALGKSRIAILVGGMGLSASATEKAIAELPPGVTLAFAPYGRDLADLARRARRAGHEIMLQMPMEPYDFPDNDPGPQTLLTGLDAAQNRDRLHWSMARFGGYVGVTNYMGARFSATEGGMRAFLQELSSRGLLYVEDGSSQRSLAPQIGREIGLPTAAADMVVDVVPRKDDVRRALDELEALAAREGSAIGFATGLPVTIDAIAEWAEGLEERGAALVPVSAAVGVTGS
ncbi:divergent polysaccharide deacetylase family protein [Lutibaculum baratangense]|uniref:Putative periplasmic protein n=1 Tax=Lutibaculum baratangense AMV1 TaxID=631454 RepID=V4TGX4_9HYPH|nr:divergent polysaccharide deacetylase family protein [Lutibaculum baratangense]ESR25333.1 putative periplasmic protein [Lutibaculum baratangense AMV1]